MTRPLRQKTWFERCRDPEHNPPSMMLYPEGVYVHQCPSCGAQARIITRSPFLC